MLTWGQLFLGVGILYVGAEWLVKGSAGLARAFGIAPLIVGLTVVAYGTSAPEATVGIAAALEDRGAIALGNSVGSNIVNIAFILGMTALISPPRVDGALIRREIPVLLATCAVLPLVMLDGWIERWEGIAMLAAGLIYTVVMIRIGRSGANTSTPAEMESAAEVAGAPGGTNKGRLALIALVGLGLLVGGGRLFVDAAVDIARDAGMSDRVVGLTIVALGTSLPELATSVVAALRGHSDIAVGNILGSNIFNILFILGASGTVRPLETPLSASTLDLAFMGGVSVVAGVSMRSARVIPRLEGVLLLMTYVAFLVILLVAK